MTQGNYYKRYIGRTDEPLCKEGIIQIKQKYTDMKASEKTKGFMNPDFLFVSPMCRCIQTAQGLFPDTERIVIPELREADFGIFENRAYENDLEFNFQYRIWIRGGCEGPIPGGESREGFTERCIRGFERAMKTADEQADLDAEQTGAGAERSAGAKQPGKTDRTAVFIVHGGTIMSILSRYGRPAKDYYSWHTENGHGYMGEWDGSFITDIEKI